ncbi:unnamed protein product [Calypogeia fissa]
MASVQVTGVVMNHQARGLINPTEGHETSRVQRDDPEGQGGEEKHGQEDGDQFVEKNGDRIDAIPILEENPKEGAGRNNEETAATTKQQPTVPFLRLFSFADKYDYFLMFFGSLGAAAHGCGLPIFLLFLGKLLNGLGEQRGLSSKDTVEKLTLYLVWLGLVTLVSCWIEVSFWMLTGDRQTAKLRAKYLEALLRQDVEFFDTDINTGAFVISIASDPVMVQDAISEKMANFIHFMSTFVAGFVVGFTTEWRIALVTIAAVPLIGVAGGAYAYTLSRSTALAATAYAEAGTTAEQALSQVRTVYSFVSESKFIKAYSTSLEKTAKMGAKAGLVKGIGMGVTYSVIYPCVAILLWYGGVLVRQGVGNGGHAVATIFAVVLASMSLGQALPSMNTFAKGKVAGCKIFRMIDNDSKINVVDPESGKTLDVVEGHIEIRNVDFAYPARPDAFIFRKFSLVIPPGKTVAIVGSSGSGKSTVISLIERFYDPIAGEVLLDGHDIKKLNLKWLRGRIGLVNQEPALFATTIAANILYGKENATQDEIEAAAKAANAHSFIENLPLRYQTQVGERGIQLSGGQRQRVAIARAMLRNPAILLLDEATSALDAGSEQIVQEALEPLMLGRTTIVVAHQLSTIRNANTIAVVQHGQIVEKGTHQELICREDGAYSALVRLQELAAGTNTGVGTRVTRPTSSITGQSGRLVSYGQSGRSILGQSGRSIAGQSGRLSQGSCSGKSSSFSMKPSEKGEAGEKLIQKESGGKSKGSLIRLLKMCKPDWKYGMGGVIGSMLAGCPHPIFGLMIGEALTAYYQPSWTKMESAVRECALILVAVGVSTPFIYILQNYSLAVLGENLVKRVRKRMFSTILQNELGWFDQDENYSGQILFRLSSDASNVRAAIGDRAALILQIIAILGVSWITSIVLQWKLALVIISVSPFLTLSVFAQRCFLKGFAGDLKKAYAQATQVAGEAVSNIRTVAAFNAQNKVQSLFAEELKGPSRRSFLRGQVAGLGLGLCDCLMYCSYGLGMWYSGKLMTDEGAKFGNVIKVFFILITTSYSLAETLALTPNLMKGGQVMESMFEVLDRKTAIEPDDPDGEHAEKVLGDIQLKNVTFAYPSRPDVVIFRDLNLKVQPGHNLALVGASGSGKSSVIALIERFYDPISGQVLIDGKDLKKYNLRSVRQHIALVSQEPALFSCSIYENILYGKDGASEAEVTQAAIAANAHSFICSLPEGYQTQVGERGVQLSGGQKQRVAIARAVLKDPAILLLDEATSALDAESEKMVQEALDRLMKGRTTVIIAHRLTTIQGADTITIVEDGTIIEEGSHADLIAKHGEYARLLNLQNRHKESPTG